MESPNNKRLPSYALAAYPTKRQKITVAPFACQYSFGRTFRYVERSLVTEEPTIIISDDDSTTDDDDVENKINEAEYYAPIMHSSDNFDELNQQFNKHYLKDNDEDKESNYDEQRVEICVDEIVDYGDSDDSDDGVDFESAGLWDTVDKTVQNDDKPAESDDEEVVDESDDVEVVDESDDDEVIDESDDDNDVLNVSIIEQHKDGGNEQDCAVSSSSNYDNVAMDVENCAGTSNTIGDSSEDVTAKDMPTLQPDQSGTPDQTPADSQPPKNRMTNRDIYDLMLKVTSSRRQIAKTREGFRKSQPLINIIQKRLKDKLRKQAFQLIKKCLDSKKDNTTLLRRMYRTFNL